MYQKHSKAIESVISDYFRGIYTGDTGKLEGVFYRNAELFGDVKGEPYFRTFSDYLDGVRNRKCPEELGEDFRMEILSMEVIGSIAMVKAHVPMLGFNYYDLLSLHFLDGEWKIVNKLFSHIE